MIQLSILSTMGATDIARPAGSPPGMTSDFALALAQLVAPATQPPATLQADGAPQPGTAAVVDVPGIDAPGVMPRQAIAVPGTILPAVTAPGFTETTPAAAPDAATQVEARSVGAAVLLMAAAPAGVPLIAAAPTPAEPGAASTDRPPVAATVLSLLGKARPVAKEARATVREGARRPSPLPVEPSVPQLPMNEAPDDPEPVESGERGDSEPDASPPPVLALPLPTPPAPVEPTVTPPPAETGSPTAPVIAAAARPATRVAILADASPAPEGQALAPASPEVVATGPRVRSKAPQPDASTVALVEVEPPPVADMATSAKLPAAPVDASRRAARAAPVPLDHAVRLEPAQGGPSTIGPSPQPTAASPVPRADAVPVAARTSPGIPTLRDAPPVSATGEASPAAAAPPPPAATLPSMQARATAPDASPPVTVALGPPVASAPAQPAAPQPAAQAFAAAMFAADRAAPARPEADDPAGDLAAAFPLSGLGGNVPATPLAVHAVAPSTAGTLDMTRDNWMGTMIERIETLTAEGGTRETRMRLAPDALGQVDIAIRQDASGAIEVRIAADTPQARAILADAAPRLAEMAEQRGLKLGGSGVDAGAANTNSGSGGREPQRPAPALAPRSAAANDAGDVAADTRLA